MRTTFLITFVASLLLVCAHARTSSAQTDDSSSSDATNKGAWALQFRIGPNFTLTDFQGGIISAKYHHSNSQALRFGVRLGGELADQDSELLSATERVSPDPRFDSERETTQKTISDESSLIVGVEAQYLFHPTLTNTVRFFWGLGPTLSYSRSETRETIDRTSFADGATDTETTKLDVSSDTWQGGVLGVLGVEWFASSSISFTAEYGTSLEYFLSDRTQASESVARIETPTSIIDENRSTESVIDRRGWQINSAAVRFGISVYL